MHVPNITAQTFFVDDHTVKNVPTVRERGMLEECRRLRVCMCVCVSECERECLNAQDSILNECSTNV